MAQLIGDTLGPYRILERLGVGGMAEVYKAYQPSMDRYVAIKVILQRFAQDATFLQRFQREARAVSRLEHPFILPVHDYGEAEGRPYLVMRYMGAGTLKDRLSGQPMPLDEANRIVGQVGGALDYAHRTGIIHRDVKPTNVLMDAEGNAFLTDFGLAKMMEASVQLTGTGVGIGTPAYMSPEQGQGETVDSRTDIYSLGVMLYEMALGRRPFQADTPLAVVYKHVHEPLPLPRGIRPDLPETVERVILRAMAKDREDRFETVGEMVQALDAAVRSAEGAEPPRRRARLWLIPALMLLFVAILALWRPWAKDRVAPVETVVVEKVPVTMPPSTPSLGPPSPQATATLGIIAPASATPEPTNTPPPPPTPAPALTPTLIVYTVKAGDTLLAIAAMHRVELQALMTANGLESPNVFRVGQELIIPLPSPVPPTAATNTATATPTPLGGGSGQIAFVSDRDGNREIYLMNADGAGLTRLTHNQAGDDTPSWSPDGQRIALVSVRDGNWEIYVMSPDGSGQTRLTHNESHDYGPSWSPDGQRIAFCSYRDGNAEIYVMKADGSAQIRLTHNEAHDWYPSWSPDGPRIAFASERDGNAEIYLMNADGSGQIRLSHNQVDDWVPDWSPDGQRIAFDSERDGNYEVYMMKADGSRQIRLTHNEVADFGPDWSPDGQRIAFCSRRDGNEEIYVMSADGSGQTRLTDNQALDRDPSWRP